MSNLLYVQKSHEQISASNCQDEPLLSTVQTNDNNLVLQQPSTFDKILQDSNANAAVNKGPASTKINSVMSGSR